MIDDMKKILLLALPLMVICFASSCEKNKGNDDVNSGQKLVKEISWTEDDYQEQLMFEYDGNARVINVAEIVDGNVERECSVTYNGNTITEKNLFRNYETGEWGEYGGITCYYLNNDGYLIKSESIRNGEVTMYTMYEYAGNQLKSIANYDADGTEWNPSYEYEWQNDDIRYEYQSGSPYPNKYDYTDAENKLNISFCNPVIVAKYHLCPLKIVDDS